MPTTYLLLRDNKQTGPLSLDELLQQALQPLDLIWEEGRSAGWRYPSEINTLHPYVSAQKTDTVPKKKANHTDQSNAASDQNSKPIVSKTSHIYVSLPAGMQPRTAAEPSLPETPSSEALEAKAEALYQRVQAFSQGHSPEEPETRYARSLEEMKQEYGAWTVKQQKKKKSGVYKRKILIAASVLIVTTTGFGISEWIGSKPRLPKPAITNSALRPLTPSEPKQQAATASFEVSTDSFRTRAAEITTVQNDPAALKAVLAKNGIKPTSNVLKKTAPESNTAQPAKTDTTSNIILPTPVPEEKPAVQETKTVVPLSRSVTVNGSFSYDTKRNTITTTQITLQNNSSETLKSVAVAITYFKKENRPLNKEIVYFYNVQPATAPALTVSGNRKATSARFEIGTITRADGSLYFIH